MQKTDEPVEPVLSCSARLSHVLEQAEGMRKVQSKARAEAVSKYKQTMRQSLTREVLPAVVAALVALAEERPVDALSFVSKFLLRWADDRDLAREDPYDAPIYAERRQMNYEKAQREQERKEAFAAKMQREKDARAAADASLHEMLLDSMRKHESMLRS